MSAHAAPHPVVPGTDNRCGTCRQPIAYRLVNLEDVRRVFREALP